MTLFVRFNFQRFSELPYLVRYFNREGFKFLIQRTFENDVFGLIRVERNFVG